MTISILLSKAQWRKTAILLGAGLFLATASALVLRTVPVLAQTHQPIQGNEQNSIDQRLGRLRELPDDERARVTKQLALDIRALSQPAARVGLAASLANLATEGDFGYDTLQEVATTLAEALRAQPVKGSRRQSDSAYMTLAQLVLYEKVKVLLNTPQLAAAMSKLKADDQRRQEADFTLTDLQGKQWTLKSLHGKVVRDPGDTQESDLRSERQAGSRSDRYANAEAIADFAWACRVALTPKGT